MDGRSASYKMESELQVHPISQCALTFGAGDILDERENWSSDYS